MAESVRGFEGIRNKFFYRHFRVGKLLYRYNFFFLIKLITS